MVGGGYLEDLLKGFSSLQAGQTGGVVDQSRVALLPSVVPKLHEVDMVSFGGIIQQRLNECQAAFSNVRNRLKDWADFDNIFLSIMNKGEKMETIAAQLQINKNTYDTLMALMNNINITQKLNVDDGTDITSLNESQFLHELYQILQTINGAIKSGTDANIAMGFVNINVLESFIKQYCDWIVSLYRNWQCDPSAITTKILSGNSNEELKKIKETVLINLKNQIKIINDELKDYLSNLKVKNSSGKTPMEILIAFMKANNNVLQGGKKRRSAKKSSKKHRGGKKKSSKKHRGGKKKSSKRRSSKKRSSGRR
jgi:hypothetical protein